MTNPKNENSDFERKLVPVVTEIEPVEQGRSLVVVIGINEYVHWQKLKNAVQDAIGLQQTLIDKLGFSAPISPLINEAATKLAITSLIEDQLRDELQEDDNLVLFFAGHGHTRVDKIGGRVIGETGFIVPVEARGPKEVWGDYIQIDPLLQSISRLPARHILVILDSCHSGFALGEAMKSFRDAVRYEKDLSSRISRKVITSARREQLALDGGPIPGHSLFTGTLVDGFNWGKADLDGNGLITSSELGLFIQQKVGQASESKQTPDFGSFYHDDRGEMVISLRNQSFDALKARAFSALQSGKFTIFKELVDQIIILKPSSPESIYLEYRSMLLEYKFEEAIWHIDRLLTYASINSDFKKEVIPLSFYELELTKSNISENLQLLEALEQDSDKNEAESLLGIIFYTGKSKNELKIITEQDFGDIRGYIVESGYLVKLSITNNASYKAYVYMLKIDSVGRLTLGRIWENAILINDGIKPQETQFSYTFILNEPNGIYERYIISSDSEIPSLSAPSFSNVNEILDDTNFSVMKLKKYIIRYRIIQSSTFIDN